MEKLYGIALLRHSGLLKPAEKPKVALKRIISPYNKTVHSFKLLIFHNPDLLQGSFSFREE